MTTIVGIDVETTGLVPGYHDVWEIAVVVRDHRDPSKDGEWLWRMQPNLTTADPTALRLNRYYERQPTFTANTDAVTILAPLDEDEDRRRPARTRHVVALDLAQLLDGATLVAANPAFDAGFLDVFLRAHGQAPAHHYRMLDVGSLTAGKLGRLVGGLADCANALGVEYDPAVAHTALADAKVAMGCYDAVIGAAS